MTIAAALQAQPPTLASRWLALVPHSSAPNIGLLQAGRQSIADRFTHLAMIVIVIAMRL